MISTISDWARLSLRCGLAMAILSFSVASTFAGPLDILGTAEQDAWSDFAFPAGVTGSFDAGTLQFTVSASPSNDLELGGEFGPSNAGRHYGSGGTIGSAFSASLSVSGVEIQSDGTVTNGGTVSVVFNAGAPDSVGADYGVAGGGSLLTGTVLGVLMDATGSDTLDVLYQITGGALQNPNPELGPDPVVFSSANLGLIRIAGGGITLPADFSQNFSVDNATVNNFGIPEPGTVILALLGGSVVLLSRKERS